jgi:transcriptional regulator with XRE-family HTH domain
MTEFGTEIKRLRTEKGWSQAQLAVYSETSQPTVNQIETGKRNPSTETLVKLARALGVEVVDLFPKADRRSSPEPKLFNGFESERRAQPLGSWKTYISRRVEWGEGVLQKSPEDDFNNPFLSLDTAIQWAIYVGIENAQLHNAIQAELRLHTDADPEIAEQLRALLDRFSAIDHQTNVRVKAMMEEAKLDEEDKEQIRLRLIPGSAA